MSGISLYSLLLLFHSTASQAGVFEIHQRGTEIIIIERDSKGNLQQYDIDANFLDNDEIFGLISKLDFADLPTFEQVGIRKKISSALTESQLLDLLGSLGHTLIVNEDHSEGQEEQKERLRNEVEPALNKSLFTDQARTVRTNNQNDFNTNQGSTNGFCTTLFANLWNPDTTHQTLGSILNVNRFLAAQADEGLALDNQDVAEKVNRLWNYLFWWPYHLETDKRQLEKILTLGQVPDLKERAKMRNSIVESFKGDGPAYRLPARGELNLSNVYEKIEAQVNLFWPGNESVGEEPQRMEAENETQVDSNDDQDGTNLKKNVTELSNFLETKKNLFTGVPPLENFLKLTLELKKAEDRPRLRDDLVKTLIKKLSVMNPAQSVDQMYDVSNLFNTTKATLLTKRLALNQKGYISARSYQSRLQALNHEGNSASIRVDIIPEEIHVNDNKKLLSKSLVDKGLKLDSPGFPDLDDYLKLYPTVKDVEERQEFRGSLVNAVRVKLDSLNNFSGDELKTKIFEALGKVKKDLIKMRLALQVEKRRYRYGKRQPHSDVENFELNRASVLAQLSKSQIVLEDEDLNSLLVLNRDDVGTYDARAKVRNDLTSRFVDLIEKFNKNNGVSLMRVLQTDKQAFLNELKKRKG